MQPIYRGLLLRLRLTYIYIKSKINKGEKITIKGIKDFVNEEISKLKNRMNNIESEMPNILKEDQNNLL